MSDPPYLESAGPGEGADEADDGELPLVYEEPRHTEPIVGDERVEHSWRLKEKYKTHCVALVLCLNVGVDPPDVVKTQPCARVECWIDPLSLSPTKALESIGHALQTQYERWQPRARYKQSLDPTCEDVKKLCCSLRRNAKDERVLFHYNGHGVPRPTSQGEIWVFNRTYTQYIPLSLYDLQSWMGAPSLYVYDCSSAGLIVDSFRTFADQHDRDYQQQLSKAGAAPGAPAPAPAAAGAAPPVSYRNCLQLGACAAGQALPMHPELPADLFTACLTTPVKMAMKWFVLRARRPHHELHELIDKIPGQVSDRRTMLGELNWIFTAITDTVAWSSLPPELFQRLFRADLLTASLCRNYLLADRIMRSYNCTPVSQPALPSLARHPLWAAWDQALELALAQLPRMLARHAPYQHSPFFRDQLTAFQVWLSLGGCGHQRPPPDQLPMVLQVLLSTLHRVRALQLLCGFLALGGWAARQVLAVGIFPYMLKLLQASAPDLRPTMVYIWARLLHADPSCQADLLNAKGHKYFLGVLGDGGVDAAHRTLAAFVLAGIVREHPAAQEAALNASMISVCLEQLGPEAPPPLQAWCALALGALWAGCEPARWAGVRDNAHEKLLALQAHPSATVRAASVRALGAFVRAGLGAPRTEHANAVDQQVGVALAARAAPDASALVRLEILAALQWLVLIFEQYFVAVAAQERRTKSDRVLGGSPGRVDPGQDALAAGAGAGAGGGRRGAPPPPPPHPAQLPTIGFGSVYMKLWAALRALAQDPHPRVSAAAADLLHHVVSQLDSVGRDFEMVRSASSLPPSPDTRDRPAAPAPRRPRSGLPAPSPSPSPSPQPDDAPGRDHRDSGSTGSAGAAKRAIVTTEFVEWMSAQFMRSPEGADPESRAHHQRQWRRARNARLRHAAAAAAAAAAAGAGGATDAVAFHSRCALPPGALLFHPYEQHLAVASRDNFGVWDWGTGARLAAGAWRRAAGRITALHYLNAHDAALLAVAAHSGAVRVYRPQGCSAEPRLVAAWRALDVRAAPPPRPPPAQPAYSFTQLVQEQFLTGGAGGGAGGEGGAGAAGGGELGGAPRVLLAYCSRARSLAVGGLARKVRLWDLAKELPSDDIDTESEAGVSSLWRGGGGGACGGHTLAAGLRDGGVRVWDVRAGGGCVWSRRELRAPVLAAALRADAHTMVTASADGELVYYDMRGGSGGGGGVRARARAPGPLAAAAVHPLANLVACGSVNQVISLWDLAGAPLHSIKFHEGFMGARIGPVACLAFHPLRSALGVGSKDSTVSVYVAERR